MDIAVILKAFAYPYLLIERVHSLPKVLQQNCHAVQQSRHNRPSLCESQGCSIRHERVSLALTLLNIHLTPPFDWLVIVMLWIQLLLQLDTRVKVNLLFFLRNGLVRLQSIYDGSSSYTSRSYS